MQSGRGASVVIIGGGVTGLSAGWWLAKSGIDVLVLEKGIIGWEASGRNGGGTTHISSPLFAEEQRLWPQMDDLLGYPTEYQRCRIRIALNDDQLLHFTSAAESASRQGFNYDTLDLKQTRELVPYVGNSIAGALFYNFGGHANPQRTVQAYAWALRDHKARVIQNAKVTGIKLRGKRVTAVETTQGEFGLDSLVVAAGPHIRQLLKIIDVDLPVAVARVEMAVTEPLELMRYGGVDGNGLYGRQTRRGNLQYGGGPHEWVDIRDTETPPSSSTPLLRNLALRLVGLFPKLSHLRMIRSWAGIVESTPDGNPIIERLSNPTNVVIATMSGRGFGQSPAAGRAIMELVVHNRCSFADIDSLRLARFKGLSPDWRQERGWVPSAQLTDMYE